MTQLTHFNQFGEAHMVDVGEKAISQRTAVTEGYIEMRAETLKLIIEGGHKKGDVLTIARIAGIMASKKTADLIPLCHPLPITHVEIKLVPEPDKNRVRCQTTVKTKGQTGVEMEALNATQIAVQGGGSRYGDSIGAIAGKRRRQVGPLATTVMSLRSLNIRVLKGLER